MDSVKISSFSTLDSKKEEEVESTVNDSMIPASLTASSTLSSMKEPPFNQLKSHSYSLEYIENLKVIESENLKSIIFLKSQKKFIVSDKNSGLLKIVIFYNFRMIEKFKHSHIKKPQELCLGRNDEIFVSDDSDGHKVVVFDSKLNYLRQFKLKPMNVSKMKIDLTDDSSLLYISDLYANKIIVRYSTCNKFKTIINIVRPEYMDFDENFL